MQEELFSYESITLMIQLVLSHGCWGLQAFTAGTQGKYIIKNCSYTSFFSNTKGRQSKTSHMFTSLNLNRSTSELMNYKGNGLFLNKVGGTMQQDKWACCQHREQLQMGDVFSVMWKQQRVSEHERVFHL